MINYTPSDTYRFLFDNVIADYLKQILEKLPYISIKDETIPYVIGEKFDEYRQRATPNMKSARLDRHKLASCICGAILEAKPLVSSAKDIKIYQNEKFALYVGLGLIKHYMMYELTHELSISTDVRMKINAYLAENFDMALPSIDDNICDTQEYEANLVNALNWTNHKCDFKNGDCFQYDIWAYAKIFYHLEIFNRPTLCHLYEEYKKQIF